jgi:hypothetical protein
MKSQISPGSSLASRPRHRSHRGPFGGIARHTVRFSPKHSHVTAGVITDLSPTCRAYQALRQDHVDSEIGHRQRYRGLNLSSLFIQASDKPCLHIQAEGF